MALDPVLDATSSAAAASPPATPDAARTRMREQVAQLAHEFEAMLMTQMLRDMRKSMLSDETSGDGYGADAMSDTVDVELGRALSRVGGFGLSVMLQRAMQQTAAGASGAD